MHSTEREQIFRFRMNCVDLWKEKNTMVAQSWEFGMSCLGSIPRTIHIKQLQVRLLTEKGATGATKSYKLYKL